MTEFFVKLANTHNMPFSFSLFQLKTKKSTSLMLKLIVFNRPESSSQFDPST